MFKKRISLLLLCLIHLIHSLAYSQEKKPITLKPVTIKGNKSALSESARGSVLTISKITDAKLLTLAEVLRQIPGLQIDEATGSITYLGKPITMLRDGVNVAGFGKTIGNGLNIGGEALKFSEIELNLFNLKTETPTLSFVAPRYDEGYFGSFSGNTGTNNSMLMPSFSLSKAKHMLNISPNAMFMYSPNSNNFNETNYFLTHTKQLRENENTGMTTSNYNLNLSETYFIAKEHTVNASVNYGQFNNDANISSNVKEFTNSTLVNNVDVSNKNQSPWKQNNSYAAKFSYIYQPAKSEKVSKRFDINLEYDNDDNTNNNIAISTSLNGNFVPHSNFLSINNNKVKNLFGLLGYEYKHQEIGNFEIVARYFNRKRYQGYDYTYEIDQNGTKSSIFQENDIAYNYAALLAGWDKKYKFFSLRAVLKQDYSSDFIATLKGRDKFKFATFSPYVTLFRTLNKGSIRLEMRYVQNRPTLENLSNVINYGAQYGMANVQTVGNPNLKPSKNLSISSVLSTKISQFTIVASGTYGNISDGISSYQTAANNVRITTYRNLQNINSYKADASINFYLFPRFTVNLFSMADFRHYQVDANETRTGFRWSEGSSFAYTAAPNLRFNGNVSYSGGTTFQSKSKAILNTSLSCQYNLKKLRLGLSISGFHDPYFTNYNWIENNDYDMYSYSKSRRFAASLTFGYSFGKITKSAVQGKTIQKDDM